MLQILSTPRGDIFHAYSSFHVRERVEPPCSDQPWQRCQLNPTYVPEDGFLADRLVARSAQRAVNEDFVHAREDHIFALSKLTSQASCAGAVCLYLERLGPSRKGSLSGVLHCLYTYHFL